MELIQKSDFTHQTLIQRVWTTQKVQPNPSEHSFSPVPGILGEEDVFTNEKKVLLTEHLQTCLGHNRPLAALTLTEVPLSVPAIGGRTNRLILEP